jgi:hypothetical protein
MNHEISAARKLISGENGNQRKASMKRPGEEKLSAGEAKAKASKSGNRRK